jgi:hypothetical protein
MELSSVLNCEPEISNGISDRFLAPGAGIPFFTGAKSTIIALGLAF